MRMCVFIISSKAINQLRQGGTEFERIYEKEKKNLGTRKIKVESRR